MSRRKPMKWVSLRGQCVQIENDHECRSPGVSEDVRKGSRYANAHGGKRRAPKRAKGFKKNPKYVGSARRPAAPVGYHEGRTIKTPARAAKDREGWM